MTNLSASCFAKTVQPFPKKYFAFVVGQITSIFPASRARKEGRIAIVTDVGRGMRWTRDVRRRRALMRTAKPCGPDISTLVSTRDNALHCAGTATKKPDHRGEHGIDR